MELLKKSFAEIIGTAVLVFFGCGVAIATKCDPVATSLAFGLAIVAMAYSIGNVSGCHVNPAVSLAMLVGRKISFKEFCVYVVSQLIGAGLGCLFLMAMFGKDCGFGANVAQGFLTTTYSNSKIMQYVAAAMIEVVLTFTFVLAVCGVTSKQKYTGVAGVVVGLALTLVHLIGLSLTGTSVNPARSLVPALFALFSGTEAISQVWVFIVGPFMGAFLAAMFQMLLESKAGNEPTEQQPSTEEEQPAVKEVVVKKVVTEEVVAPKTDKAAEEAKKPARARTTRKTTTTTTTRTKKEPAKK